MRALFGASTVNSPVQLRTNNFQQGTPPPLGSDHILTEDSNVLTTESGDQLVVE